MFQKKILSRYVCVCVYIYIFFFFNQPKFEFDKITKDRGCYIEALSFLQDENEPISITILP